MEQACSVHRPYSKWIATLFKLGSPNHYNPFQGATGTNSSCTELNEKRKLEHYRQQQKNKPKNYTRGNQSCKANTKASTNPHLLTVDSRFFFSKFF